MSVQWSVVSNSASRTLFFSNSFATPLSYTDNDGKEWIVFMGDRHSSSFVYDVSKKDFTAIIKNYKQDFVAKFNVNHEPFGINHYVAIDDENDVLYWLDGYGRRDKLCSLVSIDIKDWNNLKLIKQSMIDGRDFSFSGGYKMFVIGKTIHFILGRNIPQHYIFDIKHERLELLNHNIHNTRISQYSTKRSLDQLWQSLHIENTVIDAKDSFGAFYLATIIQVIEKYDKYEDEHYLKIQVHYHEWDSKFDDWIEIRRNNNCLCNCGGTCSYSYNMPSKNGGNSCNYHRIAVARTQSLIPNSRKLNTSFAFYSRLHEKMIVFDPINSNNAENNGIYSKQVSAQWYKYDVNIDRVFGSKDCHDIDANQYESRADKGFAEWIVSGYIRDYETECAKLKLKIHVPSELAAIIYNYYCIVGWTWKKSDKLSKYIQNDKCICVMSHDENDIWLFNINTDEKESNHDAYKYDIGKNEFVTVKDCGIVNTAVSIPKKQKCHAVLSKRSKIIHLFPSGHRYYE